MDTMGPVSVARDFVEAVNAGSVDRLAAMMT
jgi:hypothetical protein